MFKRVPPDAANVQARYRICSAVKEPAQRFCISGSLGRKPLVWNQSDACYIFLPGTPRGDALP